MKVEIYDTTLRDGAQGAGIAFTTEDKLKVIRALDELGSDYIEAGYYTASAADSAQLRRTAAVPLKRAALTVFCGTRHPSIQCKDDPALSALAAEETMKTVCIFGKSWLYHVDVVLRTTPEENLAMISDTVRYLRAAGKRVFYDAEHFFDGYRDDPEYALKTLRAAHSAGAERIVLCDTNGAMLPDYIRHVTAEVKKNLPDAVLGIHCHNDIGMAAASSIAAVMAGAEQVQGTVCGFGERCGNANLNTLIPLLRVKLGYDCLSDEGLRLLTRKAREICEVANRPFNENEPFVGGYAFAHKAGMHIDAVLKSPPSFEHMDPELVGNVRSMPLSALSGRSALLAAIRSAGLDTDIERDNPKLREALNLLRSREARGVSYEDAGASLALVLRDILHGSRRHFELVKYHINITEGHGDDENVAIATVKIRVGDECALTAAEGNGPVNALDLALRLALTRFYPEAGEARLTDYRVRVLDSTQTTASQVRVVIESTDGESVWRTVGVSADIIDASWQALSDAYEYMLSRRDDSLVSIGENILGQLNG